MHMADALISPEVALVMAATSIGGIAYSVKKINKDESFDEKKIPIMAVSGAFIFAAQMINFTIPGTGASGHIGGGVLLAALLGPSPALITMSAVLMIQCLFFADGGLLALGANIFNLGVIISFIVFPLIYKPLIRNKLSKRNITIASIIAVVIGLQIGSLGVVLETLASDVTELPFSVFLLLMQPIHLAIGLVEGVVTAAVLNFIYVMRPEIIESTIYDKKIGNKPLKKVIIIMLILVVLLAGILSVFASSLPDGLEWSIEKIINFDYLIKNGNVYILSNKIQEIFAFMPDYSYGDGGAEEASTAGVFGGFITLFAAGLLGIVINKYKKRKKS